MARRTHEDWITSQLSALQFKDPTWKENRWRSPLIPITSTFGPLICPAKRFARSRSSLSLCGFGFGISVAQTHWKTGLFPPNANSSPGRVIDFRSRSGQPASGAAEFDFIRHLETVEDVFANLCLVLV